MPLSALATSAPNLSEQVIDFIPPAPAINPLTAIAASALASSLPRVSHRLRIPWPPIACEIYNQAPLPLAMNLLIAEYAEPSAWDVYQALSAENDLNEPREFVIPERRVRNFGEYVRRAIPGSIKSATFITSDEILHVHPMKCLRHSPFVLPPNPLLLKHVSSWRDDHEGWKNIFDRHIKELQAIAVTESGKLVILQQAVKSCVATCVAMLVLDHGKTPNYKAISQTASISEFTDALKWVREAGLKPKIHDLKFLSRETIKWLLAVDLVDNGPGALAIEDSTIGGHMLVLDEISVEKGTANIREPFHGWSLTIKLATLLSWIGREPYFLQILE